MLNPNDDRPCYCDKCESRVDAGTLDAHGLCAACALQWAIDDEDYAEARAIVEDSGLEAPADLLAHEAELALRADAARAALEADDWEAEARRDYHEDVLPRAAFGRLY